MEIFKVQNIIDFSKRFKITKIIVNTSLNEVFCTLRLQKMQSHQMLLLDFFAESSEKEYIIFLENLN